MFRTLIFVLMLALTACVKVTETKPSYVERQLDMSVSYRMCPTVGMAFDVAVNGIVDPSCKDYTLLAPRVRGYDTQLGIRFTIIEIGPPGNEVYVYYPRYIWQ